MRSARRSADGRIAELEKEKQALEQAKASNEAFLDSVEARQAYRKLQKSKSVAEEDLVSLDVDSTVHTQAEVDKSRNVLKSCELSLMSLKSQQRSLLIHSTI